MLSWQFVRNCGLLWRDSLLLVDCALAAHRYECSHCNKSCATERLLRDHMRQHGKMVHMLQLVSTTF